MLDGNLLPAQIQIVKQEGAQKPKLGKVSVRAYKITVFVALGLVLWLAWGYWTAERDVITASFIHHQADQLRLAVRDAEVVPDGRWGVLHSLNFYIGYYDSYTNSLAHSRLSGILRAERERLVHDAIEYLRKNSTNDLGNDPYKWIEREPR